MQAAGQLSHPNIVVTHDAAEDQGVHYLVMEHVEGPTLSQLVRQHGPLAVDVAVNYILQAARGLEYAHQQGVIHRDIKPSNLLVDNSGTVKVLDMGLARITEFSSNSADDATVDELTATDSVMGTIDYMSPEQALNTKFADERADIYSLGCTLHFLLTGRRTYDGESLTERLIAHREQPIPDLTELGSGIPTELNRIFQLMVAKDAKVRYQSISDVIADLEQLALVGGSPSELSATSLAAGVTHQTDETRDTSLEQTVITHTGDVLPADASPATAKRSLRRAHWLIASAVGTVVAAVAVFMIIDGLRERPENNSVLDPLPDPGDDPKKNADSPLWQPGPAEDALPGLIPRPRTFVGIKRWQADTTAPRARVVSLAFSPDGKYIACGTAAGDTRIYDVATRKLVRLFAVDGRYLSWSPDSQRLAAAVYLRVLGLDGSVSPIFESKEGRAYSCAWHPNGDWIAAQIANGPIRLFKPDGTPDQEFPNSSNNYSGLAWTPDGRRLAAVRAFGNEVQQWTVEGVPGELLHGRGGTRNTIGWGPESRRIAVLDKNLLKILNADASVAKSIELKAKDRSALSWSPDGETLAVAHQIGATVTLLTPDGEERGVIDSCPGNVLAWSPDSRWLATAGCPVDAGTIRLWDPHGKPGPVFDRLSKLTNIAGGVNSIDWSHDGTKFATSGDDGSVRIWNADGSQQVRLMGNRSAAHSVSWSQDDRRIVAGGNYPSYPGQEFEGGAIWIWNLEEPTTPIAAADDLQGLVSWSPQGRWIAAVTHDWSMSESRVRLLSPDGQIAREFGKVKNSAISAPSWSPDGESLVVGQAGLRIWHETGREGQIIHATANGPVAWSPNGNRIVGAVPKSLLMWNSDGKPLASPSGVEGTYVFALAWSRDSTRFASGGSRYQIWKDSGSLERTIASRSGTVRALSWSPAKGREHMLLAAFQHSTISNFDADTGEHEWTAVCLADDQAATFSAGGQLIHTTTSAETQLVYVVETNDDRMLTLTPAEFRDFVKTGQLP